MKTRSFSPGLNVSQNSRAVSHMTIFGAILNCFMYQLQ